MKILRMLVVIAGIACLSACSTMKSKGTVPVEDGAQTSGLTGGAGFTDANNPNRLKAPYDQTYHFDFDKYDVHQDDIASINVQASYLSTHPKARVRLEGNADERGSREYNVALGWRRAKAIAAILEQQGISTDQIAMVSYGKEKPVAFGHDEASYSKNRRVELVYEAK